jgi:hypothetical protein
MSFLTKRELFAENVLYRRMKLRELDQNKRFALIDQMDERQIEKKSQTKQTKKISSKEKRNILIKKIENRWNFLGNDPKKIDRYINKTEKLEKGINEYLYKKIRQIKMRVELIFTIYSNKFYSRNGILLHSADVVTLINFDYYISKVHLDCGQLTAYKIEAIAESGKIQNLGNLLFNCPYLFNLSLKNYSQPKLYGLEECDLLRVLDLEETKINDLSNLNSKKLFELNICDNEVISDIGFLSKLTNLQTLCLINIPNIIDFSSLEDLTKIKFLNLSQTNFSDLIFIKNCTQLVHLDISMTRVKNLDFLSIFKKLEYLNISFRNVDDIDSLSQLTKLNELFMTRTGIRRYELSDFERIPNIRSMFIYHSVYELTTEIAPNSKFYY